MDTAISLIFAVVMLVTVGESLYRFARSYPRAFWATMGMTALAAALVVPWALALGGNGWGHAHPGLATLALLAAVAVMVAAMVIVGRRLQRRDAKLAPRPPDRR